MMMIVQVERTSWHSTTDAATGWPQCLLWLIRTALYESWAVTAGPVDRTGDHNVDGLERHYV